METRYKQPTKKIKKKRLNVARTLVFILVIYIIICFGIFIYNEPVCHYEISGNKYLSDVEITLYPEEISHELLEERLDCEIRQSLNSLS